jgi:hypothetical protein
MASETASRRKFIAGAGAAATGMGADLIVPRRARAAKKLDPDAPTIDINADSGGIQARRIVARLHAEEQAAKVATATAAE